MGDVADVTGGTCVGGETGEGCATAGSGDGGVGADGAAEGVSTSLGRGDSPAVDVERSGTCTGGCSGDVLSRP